MEKGNKTMNNTSNRYNDCTSILKAIADTWHLEAKQENENLFFYIDEVNSIKNGEKCYVIGRKGMGKTAISEFFIIKVQKKFLMKGFRLKTSHLIFYIH